MHLAIQNLSPLCDVITPEGEEGTLLAVEGTQDMVQELVKHGKEDEIRAAVQVYKRGKRGKVVFFPIKSLKKAGITT